MTKNERIMVVFGDMENVKDEIVRRYLLELATDTFNCCLDRNHSRTKDRLLGLTKRIIELESEE